MKIWHLLYLSDRGHIRNFKIRRYHRLQLVLHETQPLETTEHGSPLGSPPLSGALYYHFTIAQ